jgi:hypothetical protein
VKGELKLAAVGSDRSNSVLLDGVDITRSLRGLTVRTGVDELTTLHLDLALVDGAVISAEFGYIAVPDEVGRLLVRLGWTPPPPPTPNLYAALAPTGAAPRPSSPRSG